MLVIILTSSHTALLYIILSSIFDFRRKRQCLILPDRLHTNLGLNSNGSPY